MAVSSRMFETKPLYALVQEELSARILSGKYAPGEPLPNEWVLSTELGVSIGTLRKAVQSLVDCRLLVRVSGRGTVVADRQSRAYKAAFDRFRDEDGNPVHWSYEVHSVEIGAADPAESEKLQLEVGAEVARIIRTRTAHGAKVMYENIAIPVARIRIDAAAPADQTTVEALSEANGRAIGLIVKTLFVGPPCEAARAVLPPDDAQFFINFERLVFDSKDTPIEWCRGSVNCRRLSYVADIRPSNKSGAAPKTPQLVAAR